MRRPTVAPAVDPVTLINALQQCRTAPDDIGEDLPLRGYITAATGMAEQQTGQRLITQTWEHTIDAWPNDGDIKLPQTPVQSITSVVYVNSAGGNTTLSAGAYRLDKRGSYAVLRPVYGTIWPSDVRADVAAITITYVVGFGDAPEDVPQNIRNWILLHVGALHEQRAAVSEVGNNMGMLPFAAGLLDPWRVY